MKIIGYRNSSFNAADGSHIEGVNFYCTYPISRHGFGEAVYKFFLSNNKISRLDFEPEVGMEIDAIYNRFGKVESISLID